MMINLPYVLTRLAIEGWIFYDSILTRVVIAGWIFYDAYKRKRYKKGPSIAWTVGAVIFPFLVLLFYLLSRLPQNWALEKGVNKIDSEFMEKKYRLLDNFLMVIAIIACGVIVSLFGSVIPAWSRIFQGIAGSLTAVFKIALFLGHWSWAIGFLLLVGIIFFFKHPKLIKFHRKHAPLNYAIYIIVVMFGSGIIVGWIIINALLSVF